MSGFDPTWLALREPYDHAARDETLTDAFVGALDPEPELIDLGCGTGSNLRFLASRLPAGQRWTCVDYDPLLLARLEALKPADIDVATRALDLAKDLESLSIPPHAGVTAAALLDLTSAAWLDRFLACCRQAPLLMTLSFDGRMVWDPADPRDEAINAAFCRHQRGDKGFGPALGPDAAEHLAARLRDLGREVRLARSDWEFGSEDGAILQAMVEGTAAAVAEIDPALPARCWCEQRLEDIAAKRLTLTVGHLDLLALP